MAPHWPGSIIYNKIKLYENWFGWLARERPSCHYFLLHILVLSCLCCLCLLIANFQCQYLQARQSYDSFLCPEQNQWKWFALVRMADCTVTICAGTSSIITLKRVSAWLRLKYSSFTSKGTCNVWKQYNEWAPHSSQWTPEGLRYKFTQKIFLVMYDHKKKILKS